LARRVIALIDYCDAVNVDVVTVRPRIDWSDGEFPDPRVILRKDRILPQPGNVARRESNALRLRRIDPEGDPAIRGDLRRNHRRRLRRTAGASALRGLRRLSFSSRRAVYDHKDQCKKRKEIPLVSHHVPPKAGHHTSER